ncbi:hypothetical protein [Micromonospora sp. CPCC 206061]|uniref:hypothetical protein n=1 Tax=Micromonospora sp. CPCC 206061 TaxID=3122410 RepID=UPI002FF01F8C
MTPDGESRVREVLATVEPPPASMTVADVVNAGRRTRRRRRWLATGTAAVATVAVAVGGVSLVNQPAGTAPGQDTATEAAAAAPASCTVAPLRLPAGATEAFVNAGSPDGRYLVGAMTSGKTAGTPVVWDGAKAMAIPVDGIGEAQGVNDSGVVVGESDREGGGSFAWAYTGGKVVELPLPDGYTGAEATGINARGQVSGVLFKGDQLASAVWQQPTATTQVKVLKAPAGGAMAFGISDEGVVVGGKRDGGSAYAWVDGKGRDLPSPAGAEGGDALGVRGDWVYGRLAKAGDPPGGDTPDGTTPARGEVVSGPESVDWSVAAVWNLATGRSFTVDTGRIEAVSRTGQVTVNHDDHTASLREADGTPRPLPGVNKGAKTYAYALSDDGILAAGVSGGKPVRWSCAAR